MPDPTPAALPLRPAVSDELGVVEARYDSELARELVAEVQAEYVVRYGGQDDSPVDPEEFAPPRGSFLLVTVDGVVVGSVALREHAVTAGDDAAVAGAGPTAELKRLYVRAGHRRRGYARRVLRLAEQRARVLGYQRLVLETGLEQPEAMALYRAEGYAQIPSYGYYRGAPKSRSFAKDLAPPQG